MRSETLAFAALLSVIPPSFAETPRVEVVWRKQSLQPVAARTIYRFATCPSGLTLVTNMDGDFLAIDSAGEVRADRRDEQLFDVTASTCDPFGRLIVVSQGWLKVFEVSGETNLQLSMERKIGGGPSRLMATPNGDLYAVGLASVQGRHVFLRRFRLSDGEFLDVPDVDIPFAGLGGFNGFAVNGCLSWNAQKQEAAFFAANPGELWRLRNDGTTLAVRPQGLAFRGSQVVPEQYRRRDWQADDWIRNAVTLPDGRIVAQVFRGKSNPPPSGKSFAYLFVLDSEYRTLAHHVPYEFMGLLSGADDEGNLYFVDLLVNNAGTATKARLVP